MRHDSKLYDLFNQSSKLYHELIICSIIPVPISPMDELSEERIFGSSLHPNNGVVHNTIDEMREVHPYIVSISS